MLPEFSDAAILSSSGSAAAAHENSEQENPKSAPLCWRVHLLRTQPERLPVVLMVFGLGAGCVWLMFGAWLPALAALLLLAASVGEYLLPVTYRITPAGVYQEAPATRLAIPWKEARRCKAARGALLLTSLPAPSRLDAFRGVLLRFAPDGQPGDRDSVLAAIAHHAPHLVPNCETTLPCRCSIGTKN